MAETNVGSGADEADGGAGVGVGEPLESGLAAPVGGPADALGVAGAVGSPLAPPGEAVGSTGAGAGESRNPIVRVPTMAASTTKMKPPRRRPEISFIREQYPRKRDEARRANPAGLVRCSVRTRSARRRQVAT